MLLHTSLIAFKSLQFGFVPLKIHTSKVSQHLYNSFVTFFQQLKAIRFVILHISNLFSYISEIESREEKSKVLFDFEEDTVDEDPLTKQLDQVWAKDDLTYLEENTKYVKQREKEIHQIVQSISDLNTIFKELASMVTEQVRKFRFCLTYEVCKIFLASTLLFPLGHVIFFLCRVRL